MKRKIFFGFLIILLMFFPAAAKCEDQSIGKQFKPNPSTPMKPYYIKNIEPVTADSVEAVVEKEVRDNIPLQNKANSWSEVGFTIRPAQSQNLESTAMAPANDPQIKAIADKLKGATPLETAKNIFKFANDGTDFQYYLNSKKGALGALNSKQANCCDQSHLVVALLRAAEIPARYVHCNPCKFLTSGMVVGHVWPEAYIDGKWIPMDTTSNKNAVGETNNFKAMGKQKHYSKLPF
ncbi:MAG TPA: transglutaminase-like domain-containing protein [Candidatus Wallbacteria bacterium]|nr:transglutaminase-like domain-containing protein [Candidatus Wallbacteria bacterium]